MKTLLDEDVVQEQIIQALTGMRVPYVKDADGISATIKPFQYFERTSNYLTLFLLYHEDSKFLQITAHGVYYVTEETLDWYFRMCAVLNFFLKPARFDYNYQTKTIDVSNNLIFNSEAPSTEFLQSAIVQLLQCVDATASLFASFSETKTLPTVEDILESYQSSVVQETDPVTKQPQQ